MREKLDDNRWHHEAVRVVPSRTSVSHAWSDGVLSLTLGQFQVHAAVLVDGAGDGLAPLLPADTPVASRSAWLHCADPRWCATGLRDRDGR